MYGDEKTRKRENLWFCGFHVWSFLRFLVQSLTVTRTRLLPTEPHTNHSMSHPSAQVSWQDHSAYRALAPWPLADTGDSQQRSQGGSTVESTAALLDVVATITYRERSNQRRRRNCTTRFAIIGLRPSVAVLHHLRTRSQSRLCELGRHAVSRSH